MKKEKVVKAHTRKTKSGKTVQVKQHTAKYDASDMAKEALKNKKGAGMEIARKKNKAFDKDLDLDNMLKDPATVELFKAWDAMDSGLYNEQETGKPFKGYKKAESNLAKQKKIIDSKYGKGAGDYFEDNILDYVTFKKDGSAVFKPKVKASKSLTESPTKVEKTTKNEVSSKKTKLDFTGGSRYGQKPYTPEQEFVHNYELKNPERAKALTDKIVPKSKQETYDDWSPALYKKVYMAFKEDEAKKLAEKNKPKKSSAKGKK